DGTLLGWDVQHLKSIPPFETLPLRVTGVEFFPDSQSLLSINADGTVSLWNLPLLQESERLDALGHNVSRVLLSPDGSRLYAGVGHGAINVLDWPTRLVITNLFTAHDEWRGSGPGPGGPPGWGGPGSSTGPIALLNRGKI